MMLAHAVKSLMESLPDQQWEYGLCRYCTNAGGDDHSDGCPWLAVEKALDREKEVQDKLEKLREAVAAYSLAPTFIHLDDYMTLLHNVVLTAREVVK